MGQQVSVPNLQIEDLQNFTNRMIAIEVKFSRNMAKLCQLRSEISSELEMHEKKLQNLELNISKLEKQYEEARNKLSSQELLNQKDFFIKIKKQLDATYNEENTNQQNESNSFDKNEIVFQNYDKRFLILNNKLQALIEKYKLQQPFIEQFKRTFYFGYMNLTGFQRQQFDQQFADLSTKTSEVDQKIKELDNIKDKIQQQIHNMKQIYKRQCFYSEKLKKVQYQISNSKEFQLEYYIKLTRELQQELKILKEEVLNQHEQYRQLEKENEELKQSQQKNFQTSNFKEQQLKYEKLQKDMKFYLEDYQKRLKAIKTKRQEFELQIIANNQSQQQNNIINHNQVQELLSTLKLLEEDYEKHTKCLEKLFNQCFQYFDQLNQCFRDFSQNLNERNSKIDQLEQEIIYKDKILWEKDEELKKFLSQNGSKKCCCVSNSNITDSKIGNNEQTEENYTPQFSKDDEKIVQNSKDDEKIEQKIVQNSKDYEKIDYNSKDDEKISQNQKDDETMAQNSPISKIKRNEE